MFTLADGNRPENVYAEVFLVDAVEGERRRSVGFGQ